MFQLKKNLSWCYNSKTKSIFKSCLFVQLTKNIYAKKMKLLNITLDSFLNIVS